MKESYQQGIANHLSPESCLDDPRGRGEALTGERAGRVLSRENTLRGADAVKGSGRPHAERRQRETLRDPARSETSCMYGSNLRGSREGPRLPAPDGEAGRMRKSKDVRL